MTPSSAGYSKTTRAVTLGLILAAPAGIFVVANILNGLGIGFLYALLDPWISGPAQHVAFNVISPVVFIGGLTAAVILNTLAISRVHMRWLDHRLVTTISIQPRLANLAVAAAAGVFLAILLADAATENFSIVATHLR